MNAQNPLLKIIQLNVNSLVSRHKRHELEVFLNKHKPHIVLLNETKIKPKHKVYFQKFNFYRNDRLQNKGGGTGILIRKEINFTIVPSPKKIKSIETSIIKISNNLQEIIIVAAYFTPSDQNQSIPINDLTEIINIKSHSNSHLVIGGDLNSKHSFWGNTISNRSGENLFKWFDDNCISNKIKLLRSEKATFHRNDSHSFLDIFIISDELLVKYNPICFPYLNTLDFESDHSAVELELSLNFSIPKIPPKQIPNFSAIDWKQFNTHLESKITNIDIPVARTLDVKEIDGYLSQINEAMEDTFDKCIPLTTINYCSQIPLPANIIKYIKYKNSLRRKLHRNRFMPNANIIKSQIKNANTIIKELISIHYENHWNTKLSAIKLNNNTFKEINKITNRKPFVSIPTLINTSNKAITTPKEKAELIGEALDEGQNKNSSMGDKDFTKLVNEHVSSFISHNKEPIFELSSENPITSDKFHKSENTVQNFASVKEIQSYIKSRNNKKSSGKDKLPNYILKRISIKFIIKLTLIINHCFNIGYFPDLWKLAIVVPISKKGKPPDNPTSYRPISLLSNLSKIFEKFILEKVIDHCDEFKLIPDNQFGFRARHSTTHAAIVLKTDISINLNKKTPTLACLLDIEKAFDSVWIYGLIFKLIKFKFDPVLIRVIYNFLSERSFQVRVEDSLSKERGCQAGVPQGSLLGPILYIIFMSDLPKPIPSPIPIKILAYADDLVIYTSRKNITKAVESINEYIGVLNNHFVKWKIKINATKSEAICFKGSKILTKLQKKNCKQIKIIVENIAIENKKEVKYLGIILTENLKPYQHVKNILHKSLIVYNNIKNVLIYKSKIQKKIKLICYKQLIRPIIAYGFPVWADLSSHQMEKIRKFERKILRICSNIRYKTDSYEYISNKSLYRETETTRIDRFMIQNCMKLFEQSKDSENTLIINSLDTNTNCNEDHEKYQTPCKILKMYETNQLYNSEDQLIQYHRPTNRGTNHPVYNINQ